MMIKEFLPNPAGDDKEGEYIKLLNDGNKQIDLSGWSVKDASGKTFRLSGFLDAGQGLVLPYSQTKIALNNNGEQVFLYDASGNLADELNYSGQAKEDQLIERKATSELTGELADGDQLLNYPATNNSAGDYSITGNVIFLTILSSVILTGLGLYIILQLERKLDIKLF